MIGGGMSGAYPGEHCREQAQQSLRGETMSAQTGKVCQICHQDCSTRPRTKDAKGQYYCRECYDKAAAGSQSNSKARAGHPSGSKAIPAPSSDPVGLDMLNDLVDLAPPAAMSTMPVRACPKCHARLADGSSICAACGHGMGSSQKIAAGFKQPRSAPQLARSTIIALVVGGSLSLLWLVLFLSARNSNGASIAYMLLTILNGLTCGLWALFAAGRRGTLTALAVLVVPLYSLYFVFGVHRGKALMTATAQYLVAGILFLALVSAGDFQGRMDRYAADSRAKLDELQQPGRRSTAIVAQQPDLPPPETLEPGVEIHRVWLDTGGRRTVWVYLPANRKAGKLPCVFIAPAGTRMFHGSLLGEGDQPEHLPYVRAGFAVVAYELDGNLADHPADRDVTSAARSFKDAEAGVANARAAIDYVLAKVPAIDPQRLYSAGHSSAATVSLLVAENEPRIKACIAYAPVTDLIAHLPPQFVQQMDRIIPGYTSFLQQSSPITGVSRLRCPVFLFQADDDSIVPAQNTASFADVVSRTNQSVKFVRVASGDHYDSMIQQGVPQAIQWLNALP